MKNPVFRTLFLVYLGLLLLTAVIVLGLLWKRLVLFQTDEEEKIRTEERIQAEKQAPQLFFMEYVEGLDPNELANRWIADNADSLETFETAEQYFENLLASDEEGFSYYKADSYTDASPKYIVEAGGTLVAEVTLSGSGVNWKVGDLTTYASGDKSFSVSVPAGFIVSCNGKELGSENISEADIVRFPYDRERDVFDYDEVLSDEIKWNVYTAEGLLVPPAVEITDREGNVLVSEIADDSFKSEEYDFLVYPDEKLSSSLQDKATGFLEAYLTYYTYGKSGIDAHIAAAQAYCFSGCPADKSLINAYEDSVSWAYGHTNLRTEILGLGRPVMWADNCCSVDIEYHAYAKRGGEEVDYSRKDEMIRIVLIDKGSGYKVYAFDVSPVGTYLE